MNTNTDLTVRPIRAFDDNYIWLISNPISHSCIIVDPGDEDPVLAVLEREQLTLEAILITHKHGDHTGGVSTLVAHTDALVYGPKHEYRKNNIIPVSEGQQIHLEATGFQCKVLEVPGHTLGHVAYYSEHHLFCGDTLFIGGCGRVFEGTIEQMYQSLQKLNDLPSNLMIYCAHEYTQANLKFALAVEPDNQELVEFAMKVADRRANHEATVPSSLDYERHINPFLRCQQDAVIEAAELMLGRKPNSSVEVFAAIRDWKNHF